MSYLNFILIISMLIVSIFLYRFIEQPLVNICEIEKCPYCFGTDLCTEFKQNYFTLKKASILNLFVNYVSVKNVYFGLFKTESVVLKKLGHNYELNELDQQICVDNNASNNCDLTQLDDNEDYLIKITNTLSNIDRDKVKHFKICSHAAAKTFLNHLIYNSSIASVPKAMFLKNIWTILQLNVEPLIIQLLRSDDGWPVPHYLGACGRVIVESDCGLSLNNFFDAPWNIRATITLQLVQAAVNFTKGHPDFRFYLTDISPDNIAVNTGLKVTFVDLENIIMTSKPDTRPNIHYSSNFSDNDGFAFIEHDICESSLSDHNYYAICKLLLSRNAPWPMMKGGLLHSPPDTVVASYPRLFEAIEACAYHSVQMNCFQAVQEIIQILEILIK